MGSLNCKGNPILSSPLAGRPHSFLPPVKGGLRGVVFSTHLSLLHKNRPPLTPPWQGEDHTNQAVAKSDPILSSPLAGQPYSFLPPVKGGLRGVVFSTHLSLLHKNRPPLAPPWQGEDHTNKARLSIKLRSYALKTYLHL